MQCGLTGHFWQSRAEQVLRVGMSAVLALAVGTEMALAQARSTVTITVACTGNDTVPDATLAVLCSSLHNSLSAHYPAENFALIDEDHADAAPLLTLETFTASTAMLEARLIWRAPGSDNIDGPRMGLSISDADLTPRMQQQFLDRLVLDTPLPLLTPNP